MASIFKLIVATFKYIWAFFKFIGTILYRAGVLIIFGILAILAGIKLLYLIIRDMIKGGYHIGQKTTGFAKNKFIEPIAEKYIEGSESVDKKSEEFKKVSFKNRGEALLHAWDGLKGGKINNTYSKLKRQLGFKDEK